MKKMLVKFLKFLLRKLTKPVHHEYKMKEKEAERINLEAYVNKLCEAAKNYECCYHIPEIKELSEEELKITDVYVYHESGFSVNMKNVPSRLIQSYNFVDKENIELEVILGGEIVGEETMDVYDEIYKKYLNSIHQGPMLPEDIEINIYSRPGYNRKITLKDISVKKLIAFDQCNTQSKDLCKANVLIKYESKDITVF